MLLPPLVTLIYKEVATGYTTDLLQEYKSHSHIHGQFTSPDYAYLIKCRPSVHSIQCQQYSCMRRSVQLCGNGASTMTITSPILETGASLGWVSSKSTRTFNTTMFPEPQTTC